MNNSEKYRIVRSYLPYVTNMRSGRVFASSNPSDRFDPETIISVSLDTLYRSLYDSISNYVFDDQ